MSLNIMMLVVLGLSFMAGQVSLENNLDGMYYTDSTFKNIILL